MIGLENQFSSFFEWLFFTGFTVSLQKRSYRCVLTIIMENSVDPDQLASQKPADLDLPCFQKMDMFGFSMLRINVFAN